MANEKSSQISEGPSKCSRKHVFCFKTRVGTFKVVAVVLMLLCTPVYSLIKTSHQTKKINDIKHSINEGERSMYETDMYHFSETVWLKISYVPSTMNKLQRYVFESTVKYFLSQEAENFPYAMNVNAVKVRHMLMQGRRRTQSNHSLNSRHLEDIPIYTVNMGVKIGGECELTTSDAVDFRSIIGNAILSKKTKLIHNLVEIDDIYFLNIAEIEIGSPPLAISQSSKTLFGDPTWDYNEHHLDTTDSSNSDYLTAFFSILVGAVAFVVLSFVVVTLLQLRRIEKCKQDLESKYSVISSTNENFSLSGDSESTSESSLSLPSTAVGTGFTPSLSSFSEISSSLSAIPATVAATLKSIPSLNKVQRYSEGKFPQHDGNKKSSMRVRFEQLTQRQKKISRSLSEQEIEFDLEEDEVRESQDDDNEEISFKPIEDMLKEHIEAERNIVNVKNNTNEKDEVETIFAPPGKLGVAIDSVGGISVVHKVKEGSPLEGILCRMDRIVAIDEVNTRDMSAADVTKVMVSRMQKSRKISYIRNTELAGSFDDEQLDMLQA